MAAPSTAINDPAATTAKPPWLTRNRRRAAVGYSLISPWFIGFVIFILGPVIASIYYSMTTYNLLSAPTYVGFQQYEIMFTKDPLFWGSVRRTLIWAVSLIVIGLTGSLVCAMLLNQALKGTTFFRAAFFIPSLTPIVAAAILWGWILQPTYGPLNALLGLVGITGPGWLQSTTWAIPGLLIVRLWNFVGGGNMIIFLAGLQGIPQELYDAAHVDGASAWQRFRNITLPMLSPTIFFNLVIGIIAALKVFALAYVAPAGSVGTEGGPAYATWFYILHLYNSGFVYLQMGYASALAWVFFIAVLILTIVQFAGARRWVHYEAG
ncbi:MAG: sugar ABC transporter permease [Chloroflexota bacterium]